MCTRFRGRHMRVATQMEDPNGGYDGEEEEEEEGQKQKQVEKEAM